MSQFYVSIALVSLLLTMACSGKGKSDSQVGPTGPTPAPAPAPKSATDNHPISGQPAPAAAPVPTSLDFNPSDFSTAGCLNLQMVNDRISGLPSSTVVREYTHDVGAATGNSAPDSVAAKTRFNNMEAEISLANLSLKLKSNGEFIAGLPAIQQTDCSQLVRTDQMGNHETFEIIKSEQIHTLHLRSSDGLREEVYTLIGPRQLEIKITGPHIDRCPKFAKFQVTVDKIRSWGVPAELDADAISLTRDFARKLSSAVDSTPDDILIQLGQDSDDTIRLTSEDVSQLKSQSPSESILRCPFGSKPPSADEAPPPEQTATPTPSPAPGATPDPGATPVPAMTPVATPVPTATPASFPFFPFHLKRSPATGS